MASPLSPDHVFDFPEDDSAHDIEEFEEEPEEEPKDEPEEEPEEEADEGPKEVTGVSPINPPPLSESSSDSEFTSPVTASRTHCMPPSGSTFEVGGPLTASSLPPHLLGREAEIDAARSRVDGLNDRMETYDYDLGFIERDTTRTSNKVLVLEDEGHMMKRRLDSLEASHTLIAMDRERLERYIYNMRVWMAERMGWGAMEARPSDSIDVLAFYGTAQPPEPRRPPDAEAIEEYERSRANLENAGGSGPENVGGVVAPDVYGCLYKTFLNCKPHSFNGTEGVVGLSHWFKKMESVFEISKCAEEDKVEFVACTLEGRALTWWNGNVHALGLSNANRIPWSDLKGMMT
ncbi:hypothetical protein Tco_1136822 [Tanacetum coccineum]